MNVKLKKISKNRLRADTAKERNAISNEWTKHSQYASCWFPGFAVCHVAPGDGAVEDDGGGIDKAVEPDGDNYEVLAEMGTSLSFIPPPVIPGTKG